MLDDEDDDLFPPRPPRISRYGVADDPKKQLDGEPPSEEGVPNLPAPVREDLPAVEWRPIMCPECGDRRKRTYGRYETERYHKCTRCQTKYKSYEVR